MRDGGDPLARKRRAEGMQTSEEAADRVIPIYREAWKDGSTNARPWRSTLREYDFPRIGDKSVVW